MKFKIHKLFSLMLFAIVNQVVFSQISPDNINFVRQGVQRMIFDKGQSIPLAKLEPENIVGFSAMHPVQNYSEHASNLVFKEGKLFVQSEEKTETAIWFGGFNPFATYSILIDSFIGKGAVVFEFSDNDKKEQFFIKVECENSNLTGVSLAILKDSEVVVDKSIAVNLSEAKRIKGKIILQMLGSGLTMFIQDQGLPQVIAQCEFNKDIDLRRKEYINSFQSHLFAEINGGMVEINNVEMSFSTGIGLADIRAITYENGDPLLDRGRLWYTMSIRGRDLPHHIQGVFSMNPSVFDIKLEGIIVFDRQDGLLRNEIASHLFYDRNHEVWRGLTTGFSAYANRGVEKKQLLAIESKLDPRFGFSIMSAEPIGMIGSYEDPHILFDSSANKWRMLACNNIDGFKAIMLESDHWNKGYKKIAGPVGHDSTGTSIQKIGNKLYCFSGSSEREIFIYSYPELNEVGTLKMDLPPWDKKSRTRVWPNVVQLPEGYPFKYVALMMDRYNYPGQQGKHWSYGAVYLYHGYEP